ncbi:MAG: DUF2007 domain-containing protein [Gemmatimonadaceae bacterium]|nr:DUF2007 domain-containing protein [Gemmatimonadaceae bacterium]
MTRAEDARDAALFVIRTFSNEVDASLAEAVLEAHGIDSSVMSDNAAGMLPYLNTMHPLRLVVRGADVDAALALLDGGAPGLRLTLPDPE